MKLILSILCLSACIIYPAAGPLVPGKPTPYVANTYNNAVAATLLTAKEKNNNIEPTGSVVEMWRLIKDQGILNFEDAPFYQITSAGFVKKINTNTLVAKSWSGVLAAKDAELKTRIARWYEYIGATNVVLGTIEKKGIKKLNLLNPTMVGIILNNPHLYFTQEEATVFGAAIEAEVDICQLCYDTDPEAFNTMYKNFLPEVTANPAAEKTICSLQ